LSYTGLLRSFPFFYHSFIASIAILFISSNPRKLRNKPPRGYFIFSDLLFSAFILEHDKKDNDPALEIY